MKAPHVLPGSRRYSAGAGRIALFGLGTSLLYGLGLGSGGWAAHLSLQAVRAGREVAVVPWILAFVFMVSGMLAVVYGFFFRPRAVEVSDDEVALVKWDGKGKSLRRDQVASVKASGSSIVLSGPAGSLRIGRIYEDWQGMRESLQAWAEPGRRPA